MSLKNLTPYGRLCRKLRIDRDCTLLDVAKYLGCTSSYLSAIEHGSKVLSETMLDKIIVFYGREHEVSLRRAAMLSVIKYRIDVSNSSDQVRELVALFAKNFDKLAEDKLLAIQDIIKH